MSKPFSVTAHEMRDLLAAGTRAAKFPAGVSMTVDEVAAVVGDEFREMNENPPPEVVALREKMQGQKQAGERVRLTAHTLPQERLAAVTPSGLYGYTKAIEKTATSARNNLSNLALKLAKDCFGKDEQIIPFLQEHAKRGKSMSAKVLLAAMQDVGPKLASTHTAASVGYGLYGYKQKTAALGLAACTEIRAEAGRITSEMHQKRADDYDKLTGFLLEHNKQAKCIYAGMLMSCYPGSHMKLASVCIASPETVLDKQVVLAGLDMSRFSWDTW